MHASHLTFAPPMPHLPTSHLHVCSWQLSMPSRMPRTAAIQPSSSACSRSAQVRAYDDRAVLKHRNSLPKSLCPVGICPYLCSSDCSGLPLSGSPRRGCVRYSTGVHVVAHVAMGIHAAARYRRDHAGYSHGQSIVIQARVIHVQSPFPKGGSKDRDPNHTCSIRENINREKVASSRLDNQENVNRISSLRSL